MTCHPAYGLPRDRGTEKLRRQEEHAAQTRNYAGMLRDAADVLDELKLTDPFTATGLRLKARQLDESLLSGPECWPPRPGDTWVKNGGVRWFAYRGRKASTELVSASGANVRVADLRDLRGWELSYRQQQWDAVNGDMIGPKLGH